MPNANDAHPTSADTQTLQFDRPSRRTSLGRRGLLLASLGLVGTTGCGYILHPERRGRTSGAIDGTVLVFDLLWLLPGLLPGAVALAVDFTSGGIYGSPTTIEGPKISSASRAPGSVVAVVVEEEVVASATIEREGIAKLRWREGVDPARVRAHGVVRVLAADGRVAEASASELLPRAEDAG